MRRLAVVAGEIILQICFQMHSNHINQDTIIMNHNLFEREK